MKNIAIISSSVRDGRLSHRAALYLERYILSTKLAQVNMLDLKEYNFPLFNEKFAKQTDHSPSLIDFTDRLNRSDAVIIVTPVYNASFPAALKNVIDLYLAEWRHKPVLVVSVTYSPVPAIATAQQVQTLMLKMGALVNPGFITVTNVSSEFTEEGDIVNHQFSEKWIKPVIEEFMWLIDIASK